MPERYLDSAPRRCAGFTFATDVCLGNHVADTFISDTHVPAEGDGDWFLIRAFNPFGTCP